MLLLSLCHFTTLLLYYPILLFFLRCPSCPALFAEVGLFIAELLVVVLKKLSPIIFLSTGAGVAPFFAAWLALLLVGGSALFVSRSVFGFTSALSGGIAALFVLETALLAVTAFLSVATFTFTLAFWRFLAFFAGNLH